MNQLFQQLEPKFKELDRCVEVIAARIKQFEPNDTIETALQQQLITALHHLSRTSMLLKAGVMAMGIKKETEL